MAEITRRTNPVYKTLNRPLTIMGVERTLFATALFTGGGFQVLFSSFVGAIVIFAILLSLARMATRRDPKMLVFIIQAMGRTFRAEYDPCKYTPATIRRILSRA
ncbi:MAG TPA: VirB3 family type IV secretion system protein [Candidatus Angelobacter sp.]|nr:VirB3 family type IV secretion system protein [Candidatus Angelobacter sp.]